MTPTLGVRTGAFACVIVTPLLCFLSRNRYSWWRLEAVAAIALLALLCLILASLARRSWSFYPLLAIGIGLTVATPLTLLVAGHVVVPPAAAWMAATVASAVIVAVMREKFLPVLAAIAAASYLGVVLTPREHLRAQAAGHLSGPLPHVLYLILDEHLGIAGFPPEVPGCSAAAQAVSSLFLEYHFTLYPNAYSNYPVTLDSLPSVLNRAILPHSHYMAQQSSLGSRVYTLSANRLCEDQRKAGRAVVTCQHRSLDLNPGVAERIQYDDALGHLQQVDGAWWNKAQWLVGSYQASDPLLQRVNAFFPFRLGGHTLGPLAVRDVWPAGITESIVNARRSTLFLAHLMTPHGPYLYRKDGSIRPMQEWSGDRSDRRWPAAMYRERYGRYCEQVVFTTTQVRTLFSELSRRGLWDGMTVVVHGDHGSRIRQVLSSQPPDAIVPVPAEHYDYTGEPPLRDLLDRFSTLMAIKVPHQSASRLSPAKESLLRILARDFYGSPRPEPVPAEDNVYLFTPIGAVRPVPILNFWR